VPLGTLVLLVKRKAAWADWVVDEGATGRLPPLLCGWCSAMVLLAGIDLWFISGGQLFTESVLEL
jgi:hypothetical protein